MRSVLIALASLLVPALSAQSAVLVVDPASGPYTTIASAVAAAADGDILLLRSGAHPAVLLDGRALVLVADAGASVSLDALTVQNVPAGASTVVRGVTLDTGSTATAGALTVQSCPGNVWLEDCSVTGTFGGVEDCVTVRDCSAVVFEDCSVYGGLGSACEATGALHALRSNVYLLDSTVHGSDGYTGSFPFHFEIDGQAGVYAEEGALWIQATALQGGDGGWNFNPSDCLGSSDGAPGLVLRGTAPVATILDSTITGGFGGLGYCGPNGADAPPIDAPPGSVTTLAKTARRLETSSPVRGDETTTLTWHGLPGDRLFLVYSLGARPGLTSASYVGPLLLAAPTASLYAGTLGSSGTLAQSVGPVAPGPGVQGLSLFAQGLFVNRALHENVLSNPTHVVLLDPSF